MILHKYLYKKCSYFGTATLICSSPKNKYTLFLLSDLLILITCQPV